MNFDQYLDLNDPDGPRLVGHRIWLDHLLYEVVHNRRDADQLIERFPSLDREIVCACLLYFERNRQSCLAHLYSEMERKQKNHSEAAARNKAKGVELLRRSGLIVEGSSS